MMGRMLPLDCEHGNVIDWGDFGPDDDSQPTCPECEVKYARFRVRLARRFLRWAVGEPQPQ